MDVKKYWLGVDSYNYDLSSDDRVPTIHLTIGDMNLTLRDIPGVDSEVQLLDLEEHDQELKDRFIKAVQRVQRLSANVRSQLFGVSNVWDVMKKHTIDFIEGVLDDYEKLEIGDEIFDRRFNCYGIVVDVAIGDDGYWYFYLEKGSGLYRGVPKKPIPIEKTGKHFDFIEQYCKKEGNE